MNIDDVLKDTKEPVQSIKKAEMQDKSNEEIKEFAAKFIPKGRPKVNEKDKKKMKSFYTSDNEFEKIEKIALLYGVTPMKWIKMVIDKELRREGVI